MIQMTMEEGNVGKRSVSVEEDVLQATIDMTTEEDITKQGVKRSKEEEDAEERRNNEENKEEEECTLELGEQVDHFEVSQGIRFTFGSEHFFSPFCYNFSLSWFRNGARQLTKKTCTNMGNYHICQSSFSPKFSILGVPFEGIFFAKTAP